MPYEMKLPTHTDSRGSLTVIERCVPFEIRRVYFIYGCSREPRGGHRHKKTIQALVCVRGSCRIVWSNGSDEGVVVLDDPSRLLILKPEDYHTMDEFSQDAVLAVLASEYYDRDDYITEPYGKDYDPI
jgi:dTDP-4-dehydrorhamnose 3,5-epimerase-like enzyme